jgi:ABC-type protease/lipase transport system fused ATPase/permease subunit
METNVGGIERPVRVILGVGLVGVGAFAGLGEGGTAAAVVAGAILLLTGGMGFCPVWKVFGITTCPRGEEV